jgi:hypothetical protein
MSRALARTSRRAGQQRRHGRTGWGGQGGSTWMVWRHGRSTDLAGFPARQLYAPIGDPSTATYAALAFDEATYRIRPALGRTAHVMQRKELGATSDLPAWHRCRQRQRTRGPRHGGRSTMSSQESSGQLVPRRCRASACAPQSLSTALLTRRGRRVAVVRRAWRSARLPPSCAPPPPLAPCVGRGSSGGSSEPRRSSRWTW